jgi:hypothetical protein
MALDFPNSPTVGQTFPSPPQSGVPVWRWDGNEWAPQASPSLLSDVGKIEFWPNTIVPVGRVRADGSSYARTGTYAALFAFLVQSIVCTFTNGSSNVTIPNHGRSLYDPIKLYTTGTLPTGFTAGTPGTGGTFYYVQAIVDSNTVRLSSTPGGSAITAGSAGSGTHTSVCAPYGDGDGSSSFTVPNYCGEFLRAMDFGRGVDPNRAIGGDQLDQMQGHYHLINNGSSLLAGTGLGTLGAGASTWSVVNVTAGGPTNDGSNGVPRVGLETRPRNQAVMVTIRYM